MCRSSLTEGYAASLWRSLGDPHKHTAARTPETSHRLFAGAQHNKYDGQNIHALSSIRTREPCKRAAVDLRLTRRKSCDSALT
jgi:hypothetical protein